LSEAALAAARAAETTRQPRAQGHARLVARLRDGASRIAEMSERGSAKVRVPRTPGLGLQGVMLNTAGGITGGDYLHFEGEAQAGATLTLATQTAERAYRAQPGQVGRLDVTLRVGPGAVLEWLAQETILFDACALHRRLRIDMAEDARLLLVEPVIFGRTAMGETVRQGSFRDSQHLRRGGRLVYADETRIEGPVQEIIGAPAALAGNIAYASLIYAGPDAAERLERLRNLIGDGLGGASAFDGLISARIVSSDGHDLRRRLVAVLRGFRDTPLPRVWEM
jgi:urease accessory protein